MNTYCTDGKKFGISMIFFLDIFERHLLFSPRLHLFDQKQLYCEILLQFKTTIFYLNIF